MNFTGTVVVDLLLVLLMLLVLFDDILFVFENYCTESGCVYVLLFY